MTTTDLRKVKCVGCEGIGAHLEEAEAAEWHQQVPEWQRDGVQWLRREYRFPNFRDAFGFATRIAMVAEEQGHHPDLEIGWGHCSVALTTHALDGLTVNDFAMAARIDALLESPQG
jgi:4a-hydroxytetrahydrobiopterin dehydratase